MTCQWCIHYRRRNGISLCSVPGGDGKTIPDSTNCIKFAARRNCTTCEHRCSGPDRDDNMDSPGGCQKWELRHLSTWGGYRHRRNQKQKQTEKETEEGTGAATEEKAGAAEDAEQETEGNSVDHVVEPIYEETNEENPLRKYYIGGGVVAAILLVSAFLLFKSCGGSHLMNVEEPQ